MINVIDGLGKSPYNKRSVMLLRGGEGNEDSEESDYNYQLIKSTLKVPAVIYALQVWDINQILYEERNDITPISKKYQNPSQKTPTKKS